MASYQKYQKGTEMLQEAGNAGSDTWRLILSNTAPNLATDTTSSSASELSTGAGYTQGGVACTLVSAAQSGGVYKLVLSAPGAPTWVTSDGGFSWRYIILYNVTNSQCVGVWDYGSTVVMSAGDTLTPVLDMTNGVYTVT